MATITKKKLTQVIAQDLGLHPNDVRRVLQDCLDRLTEYLANGDRVELRDFGVFESKLRKKKIGRNPKAAEVPIIIPARLAVKFSMGKKMKKMMETKSKSATQQPSFNQQHSAI